MADSVTALTPAQIKHMIDRFLMWKLPEHFNPDCGISFNPYYNGGLPQPSRREPTGTNLFDAQQAEAMVRHMVEGLPNDAEQKTSETDAKVYRFVPGGPREGVTNLADDERIKLLACCIADQQRAGFGVLLDLRQIGCPNCGAAGFNTGWGAWQHLCGAEILVDGDVSVACPKPAAEKKR